tara:strand:- start:1617 stop:2732 length:1116 start_codon:yes stop_codon:yes gene_type:complete
MFLVVTRNFPPDVGGMQMLMWGLTKALVEHGPVKVFADEFKNDEAFDKKSSINIQRVKGIKLFRKYRKANLVNDFIKESTNIRALFLDHWKSLEHINKNYLKKTKVICLVHSKEINHTKDSRLNGRLKKSLESADFVVANSNFTKNLSINVGIDHNKICVINPGIDKPKILDKSYLDNATKYFKNFKFQEDSFPKIITVARLDKRKNHEKILMTIKNLKSKFPKIKYISIGGGEEKNNLLKLINELDIKDNVSLLEDISENLKLSLIASSNMFLMPSIIYNKSVEGFGISFMEAASYGVGSIGGKDGGASDAIVHNKTGLICDGNNLNSIYDSTITFLDNENYIKFGKEALKFSENFHWKRIVKSYLKLIN